MNSIIKAIGVLFLIFIFINTVSAQDDKLSAQQILQHAIDITGGDAALDSLNGMEFFSQLVTPKNDTLSFAIKRKDFNKYFISSISKQYENTITIYNNGDAIIIQHGVVKKVTDPLKLEEYRLQCYGSIDYAYKKLKYTLSRQKDQKFTNYDCYVVMAESPLGRKTLNYYEKKTGNLLMVIYPDQNKSIFIEYNKAKGIQFPTKILLTDPAGQITQSSVQTLDFDNTFDANWFNLSKEGAYNAPDSFKTGTFKYVNSNNGELAIRNKDTQFENINGVRTQYKIEWTGNNDYLMYRFNNDAPPVSEKKPYIWARIIQWIGNRYYCQYITSDNIGGSCIFEKKE